MDLIYTSISFLYVLSDSFLSAGTQLKTWRTQWRETKIRTQSTSLPQTFPGKYTIEIAPTLATTQGLIISLYIFII